MSRAQGRVRRIQTSLALPCGALAALCLGAVAALFFLAGVDNARFRKTVVPGDQLVIQVNVDKVKRGIWWYRCEASVDGKLAVAADIMCAPGGER